MRNHRRLFGFIAAAAATGVIGCSDDMMSMTDELDRLTSHQDALETERVAHHREVLGEGDPGVMRRFEARFGLSSVGHMEDMEHRMRDMRDMCSMGAHRFDGASMSEIIGRIREALLDHQGRMGIAADSTAMHTEELRFRDRMGGFMMEMSRRRSDVAGSASGYICRMHGH